MTTHHLQPNRPNLHANFSANAAPVLTVESGDTVVFATPDVGWGLEPPTSTTAPRKKVEPRDPVRDAGPCLCGPVAIRDAKPGDTLEILIETVRPGSWGWTYAGKGISTQALNNALGVGDAELTLLRWTLDHERRVATNQLGHTVAMRPFMGIIGLSPASQHASAWTPCSSGGNMDCRELIAGTTLYLPVMAAGGLLSVGDGHAAQGDGELSGTAIECAMDEVKLRLTLHPDLHIRGPHARTTEGWVTLGFGTTLDDAAVQATSGMLDIMQQELAIPRAECLALASSQVSLRITQVVNPLRGVHAVWTR